MPRARTAPAPAPAAEATIGFGVPLTADPHHFRVHIPKGNAGKVRISEYLGLQAASNEPGIIDRVLLERARWTAIRAEVQRAFNARLTQHGLSTSAWKVDDNPVDRLLGKELCVLAWAVERMDPAHIGVAVRNWLALRPEERWWLFGMTALVTGGVADAGKGWRAALEHALGDLPTQSVGLALLRTRRSPPPDMPAPQILDLFGDVA